MKRSDFIAIGVVCGAAATALLWHRPNDPGTPAAPEEMVFAGGSSAVDDCVGAGIGRNTCAADYQRALAAHQAQAPVFTSAEGCQVATDSTCEARPAAAGSGVSAGAVFVPVMAGFVLSHLRGQTGSGAYVSTPVYASRTTRGSYRALADLGRDKDDQSSDTGGAGGGWSGNGKRPRPATLSPYAPSAGANVKTSSVSRHGFGSSGFGGGG